ncbi:MAG: hypothetical protein J0L60_13955 [Ignavibacteria bacterium]|nr:hypothetical protein [Ignavibacteria bacterium]
MKVCILLLFIVLFSSLASAQKKEWEKELVGAQSLTLINDSDGCVISGAFLGTLSFGGKSFTGSANSNVFLMKVNTSGEVAWLRMINLKGAPFELKMKRDSFHNYYFIYREDGGTYIVKCNEQGEIKWEKFVITQGEQSYSEITDIAVDGNGCGYITGSFRGTLELGDNLNNSRGRCTFVAKLDTFGRSIWAKEFGKGSGIGISVDQNENIVVVGILNGELHFKNTKLESKKTDALILKLDDKGNLLWAQSAGGSDRDIAFKVLTDIQGNNYVSGIFKGNAKFGKKTLKSKGGADIFLTKIDSKGKFLWAESFGTKADEAGSHLFLRNNGTCYLFSGFMGEDRGSDENQLPMKGKNLMIVDRGGKVIGSKEIKDAAYITMMNFAEEKIGELYVLTIPSKSKNWKLIKYVNF